MAAFAMAFLGACTGHYTGDRNAEAHAVQPPASMAPLQPSAFSPYDSLRHAYSARDAQMAADSYALDARVVYEGDPAGSAEFSGRDAIQSSFAEFFAGLDPADALDLNFRVTGRRVLGDRIEEKGVYRLRAGRTVTSFGRFETARDRASGLFLSDVSGPGTRADFEQAAGPVLLEPETEELDPLYYSQFTGRYRMADGCELVVTSSVVRLFVRNTCTQSWRGLSRVDGRTWTAGDRVVSDRLQTTYRFVAGEQGVAASRLSIVADGIASTAVGVTPYVTEAMSFVAPDGGQLAGTIHLPVSPGPHPAVVLVHGSGPQDRRGYASIIGVLADAMAAKGVAVLAFDKRGVGASEGAGGSFQVLGTDVAAAVAALRLRRDILPGSIGIAGSSQAGWVAAKSIDAGANPTAVLLISAAGAGLDVREQNLFNTRARMECGGLEPSDVHLGLEQQRAFFNYVLTPNKSTAVRLDALTEDARKRPALADWLFPASAQTDLNAPAWFTTLELGFDPMPVWAAYGGSASFVFAEFDDATPTTVAVARLRSQAPRASIRVLVGAQHLGLRALSLCKGELDQVEAFHPGLFEAIDAFASDLRASGR